jgi:hypothetical protein
MLDYRKREQTIQRQLDAKAPKVGDMAPDFCLSDPAGEHRVCLSDYRDRLPVALVFGSFT